MMRLLMAKVLPLGLTGAFLQSSISPLRPALNAFMAANAALAGQSTQDSGADFEGMLKEQLGKGGPGGGGAKAPPANAKDQLNDIIAQVKGQNGETSPHPVVNSKPSKPPAHSPAKHAEAPPGPETKLTAVTGK
jgi:hypothetical protein